MRVQTDIINFSPCRSRSQVNLKLAISRSSAKTAKKVPKKRDSLAELLF